VRGVEEQKLLLGFALFQAIDEPLQGQAGRRHVAQIEVLRREVDLPLLVLERMAGKVHDQLGVGRDLAEALRKVLFQPARPSSTSRKSCSAAADSASPMCRPRV